MARSDTAATNQDQQSQSVTVDARDRTAPIPAAHRDRIRPMLTGAAIIAVLQDGPLYELEIERVSMRAPVRDVEF